MDGTLVDSFEAHWISWDVIARENNVVYTRQMYDKSFGRSFTAIVDLFWARDGIARKPGEPIQFSPDEMRAMDKRKEQIYRDAFRDNFVIMPGAIGFLNRLKEAGYKIAIGTSGPQDNLDMVLDLMPIRNIIEATVAAEDVTRCKPAPDIFLKAAQKLGVPASRCCVFEDSDSGIQAAVAANMPAVGIYKPEYSYSTLEQARYRIQSFDELSVQQIDELLSTN